MQQRYDGNATEYMQVSRTQGPGADAETVGGETGWRMERRLDNYNEMVLLADSLN